MPMSRVQKEQEVQTLKERFEENDVVVVAHYSGLSVLEMSELRSALRAEGATFKVAKNSLVKRALTGTKFEEMAGMFSGPTGVAVSNDPGVAKIAYKFAKSHDKLVLIGGAMGEQIMSKAEVEQLAKLPSLDELRGTIIGLLQAPAQKIVGVVAAPAGGLARVIGAYAAKGE